MRIDELMTRDVITCRTDDSVLEAALKMKSEECGLIAIVEENGDLNPVGVITDRDITCRVVAAGEDPRHITLQEVMSRDVITINYHATFNAAVRLMEENRIQRLLVTGNAGGLLGILSLTDLARAITQKKLGEAVREISQRNLRS